MHLLEGFLEGLDIDLVVEIVHIPLMSKLICTTLSFHHIVPLLFAKAWGIQVQLETIYRKPFSAWIEKNYGLLGKDPPKSEKAQKSRCQTMSGLLPYSLAHCKMKHAQTPGRIV